MGAGPEGPYRPRALPVTDAPLKQTAFTQLINRYRQDGALFTPGILHARYLQSLDQMRNCSGYDLRIRVCAQTR